MISSQVVMNDHFGQFGLSADIHHNETLLTLPVDSQVERIDLSEVRL
jgi:hypothetical protein